MNSSLKKGLFLVTVIGTLTVPGERAEAAAETALPGVGIEQVLNECYAADGGSSVGANLVPGEKGEYSNVALTNVGADTFLYVRSEPSRESAWVGKLYPGSASEIIGPVGEWTRVQSGTVTGYVYTEYIITGNEARQKAQEIAAESETRLDRKRRKLRRNRKRRTCRRCLRARSPEKRRRPDLPKSLKRRRRRRKPPDSQRKPRRRPDWDRPLWNMPASLSGIPMCGAGQA